jgi:hypothetical protein
MQSSTSGNHPTFSWNKWVDLNTVPSPGFKLTTPWILSEGVIYQIIFGTNQIQTHNAKDFYNLSWLVISWLFSEYTTAISRIYSTSTTHTREWKIYFVHLPIRQLVQEDNFSQHSGCRRLCSSLKIVPCNCQYCLHKLFVIQLAVYIKSKHGRRICVLSVTEKKQNVSPSTTDISNCPNINVKSIVLG